MSVTTALYRQELSSLESIRKDLQFGRVLDLGAICFGLDQITQGFPDPDHGNHQSNALQVQCQTFIRCLISLLCSILHRDATGG